MLLVAEDIHWADSASLLTILSVARQLPLAALLVVVTARSSPQPAPLERLLADLAAGSARTLQLQPLSSDDVAALARDVLGAISWPRPDHHADQGRWEPAMGRGHDAFTGR